MSSESDTLVKPDPICNFSTTIKLEPLSFEEAIEKAEVIFDDVIADESVPEPSLEAVEQSEEEVAPTRILRRIRTTPRYNSGQDKRALNELVPHRDDVDNFDKDRSCEGFTRSKLRPTRTRQVVQPAPPLKQHAKRRRRNAAMLCGRSLTPILRSSSSLSSSRSKHVSSGNNNADDIEIDYQPHLSEISNSKDCHKFKTMLEVLQSIPGLSLAKIRKKSNKKLSAMSALQMIREGSVDFELPDSILGQVNVRSLLNKSTFTALPPVYQYKLIHLLPQVDIVRDHQHSGKIRLRQSALTNEFFTKALRDWTERLLRGDFTPEAVLKKKVDIERDIVKLDPWKLRNFQPIWGFSTNQMIKQEKEVTSSSTATVDEAPSNIEIETENIKVNLLDVEDHSPSVKIVTKLDEEFEPLPKKQRTETHTDVNNACFIDANTTDVPSLPSLHSENSPPTLDISLPDVSEEIIYDDNDDQKLSTSFLTEESLLPDDNKMQKPSSCPIIYSCDEVDQSLSKFVPKVCSPSLPTIPIHPSDLPPQFHKPLISVELPKVPLPMSQQTPVIHSVMPATFSLPTIPLPQKVSSSLPSEKVPSVSMLSGSSLSILSPLNTSSSLTTSSSSIAVASAVNTYLLQAKPVMSKHIKILNNACTTSHIKGSKVVDDLSRQLGLQVPVSEVDASVIPKVFSSQSFIRKPLAISTLATSGSQTTTATASRQRSPKGKVNIERSYEICRSVVLKSVNRSIMEHQLRPIHPETNTSTVTSSCPTPPTTCVPSLSNNLMSHHPVLSSATTTCLMSNHFVQQPQNVLSLSSSRIILLPDGQVVRHIRPFVASTPAPVIPTANLCVRIAKPDLSPRILLQKNTPLLSPSIRSAPTNSQMPLVIVQGGKVPRLEPQSLPSSSTNTMRLIINPSLPASSGGIFRTAIASPSMQPPVGNIQVVIASTTGMPMATQQYPQVASYGLISSTGPKFVICPKSMPSISGPTVSNHQLSRILVPVAPNTFRPMTIMPSIIGSSDTGGGASLILCPPTPTASAATAAALNSIPVTLSLPQVPVSSTELVAMYGASNVAPPPLLKAPLTTEQERTSNK